MIEIAIRVFVVFDILDWLWLGLKSKHVDPIADAGLHCYKAPGVN